MRRILLTAFVCVSSLLLGQSRDLYSLAKGDYLGFNAVFDKDENLYGYVAMYGYGKSGDKTKKFEYVFLDRNLNPVANKEFEGDITAEDYYGVLDHNNKLLLIPSSIDAYAVKEKHFFRPRTMVVDLKTNEVKYKVYYDYNKGVFNEIAEPKTRKNIIKEVEKERRKNGFVYYSYISEIKEGGFIVTENDDYEKYYKNQTLKRYDKDKKLMWEYRFNEDGTKEKREYLNIIDKDDKHIYTLITKEEKKNREFFLQVFDMKTGKILHNKQLEGLNQDTWGRFLVFGAFGSSIDNDKSFDDKTVIFARYWEDAKKDLATGFVRIMIDKKTFTIDTKTLFYEDFKPFLKKIDNKGYVENNYRLANKDLFFLKDGSIGILLEEYKLASFSENTRNMVYAITDKDFKLKEVKVLEKQVTKNDIHSDYLFSQYLNKGKDVVFFYRDYKKDKETKEKHWYLFINTLIDGKFNQEVIKIFEKDKYFISPYVAKEGYILLREYNEKDKYNQIRLERLNY